LSSTAKDATRVLANVLSNCGLKKEVNMLALSNDNGLHYRVGYLIIKEQYNLEQTCKRK